MVAPADAGEPGARPSPAASNARDVTSSSDGRRRYSIATLLSLRHKRLNHSIDHHAISRAGGSPADVLVSREDELAVDASGRLRTSDVLWEVGAATFADMRLPAAVVAGLTASGFDAPSPVQSKGIPVGRLGADVVAQAKSGTGKTVVFAALIAEASLAARAGSPAALVLAPTRELARQTRATVAGVVARALAHARGDTTFTSTSHVSGTATGDLRDVALLVGGGPVSSDLASLRHALAAVGTPGRVRALLETGMLDAGGVRMLVLDEADRLLDPCAGFALGKVAGLLRGQRQTLAFSATYTPRLVARLRAVMREPQVVWLGEEADTAGDMHRSAVLKGVRQFRVDVPAGCAKEAVFVQALAAHEFGGCLAFTGNRDAAAGYAAAARKAGFAARHVSAKLTERQRREVVEEFASGRVNVLVCTDVMARGVSFDQCDFVVQLDVAINTETHLHRVGRAGRFGTIGVAVVVVDAGGRGCMRVIEADIGKLPAWPEATDFDMETRSSPSPRKRKRTAVRARQVVGDDRPVTDGRAGEEGASRLAERWIKATAPVLEGDNSTLCQHAGELDPAVVSRMASVASPQPAASSRGGGTNVSTADVLEGVNCDTGGRASSTGGLPPPITNSEPQSADLSGPHPGVSRATCDEAWTEGFDHGYRLACDVIRQICSHR